MLDTMTIRLADGTDWEFPGPGAFARRGPADLARRRELLGAIAEAEDECERRLGELALAIFLLGLDRDLGPDEYRRLLAVPPGDPRAEELRADFRALARAHAEAVRPRASHAPASRSRHWWPGFRSLHHRSRGMTRC